MEFCEIIWRKPAVARKLAVGHCVRQLVFWLLVVSSFNYFKMHTWSTSMLISLLLHSQTMLSMVKMLLKGEVGGCAFKLVMGITLLIMENHGKIMEVFFFNFFWNPGITIVCNF